MRSAVVFLTFFVFAALAVADRVSQARAVSQTRAEDNPQAFVPILTPLNTVEAMYPAAAREQKVAGFVDLLLMVDPQGNVSSIEVLTGPQLLRQAALDAAKQYKFRPVIRDGRSVSAYTGVTVDFPEARQLAFPPAGRDMSETMKASQRMFELRQRFPRSREQELADLEQDATGGDEFRRANALSRMAQAAADAGLMDKAETYALEAISSGPEWNRDDNAHRGNIVLGRVALSRGDVARAGYLLLEAGKVQETPTLGSFGPNMALAKELLEKGEKDAVLAYFELCHKFWKTGGKKLDEWTALVRAGLKPDFGANLVY